MLKAIIGFSVRRPGVILGIALLVLFCGLWKLLTAGLDIFPEFSPKQVIIQTEAPGYSPVQVETGVSKPIEQVLSGLNKLQRVNSESIQGLSVVTATFEADTDIYRNRQLVSERLASIAGHLPESVASPVPLPLSSSSATIMTLGVHSGSHSPMQLREIVDTVIAPQLLATTGVSDINIFGGSNRQLQIQLRANDMINADLSMAEIIHAASQLSNRVGLGFIENSNQRFTLKISDNAISVESLKNIVIRSSSQGVITLDDVADIRYGAAPAIGAAAINSKPGIVIMVIGQYGANTLTISRQLESKLEHIRTQLQQQHIELHTHLFRPADYIQTSVTNLTGHLLIGALFVVIVLFLFLFNLRVALIATLAIPLSLISAGLVLTLTGVKLNIMILGGLAIVLGEVVDDAIIDAENILRRLKQLRISDNTSHDLPAIQSTIIDASLEVRSSVVYATFIVALVFVPLLTLSGVAGRLYAPLGYAYILAILMSLLVALTVTPALCVLFLKPADQHNQRQPLLEWIQLRYQRLLGFFIARPTMTIVISTLTVFLGVLAATQLQHEFIPKLREGHFMLHTSSRPGTSLTESIRSGSRISEQLLNIDGIESVSQWAGRAERGADTYGSHYSEYEIRLTPMSGQQQQRVYDAIRAVVDQFPGMLYELNTFLIERVNETISGYSAPLVIHLYGKDFIELDQKAMELANLLSTIDGIKDVRTRSQSGAPTLDIEFDHQHMKHWGVQPGHIISTIQTALSGTVVGQFQKHTLNRDIVVSFSPELRTQPELISSLPMRTESGQWITLGDVITINQKEGRYNILHQNSMRLQTITADIDDKGWNDVLHRINLTVSSSLQLPADMSLEISGAAVSQGASKRQLLFQSLLVGIAILLVIYLALSNLSDVFITLFNLPFALVGGIFAALITNTTVSVGSMVGFVTLFGITVRNSIMLISHYTHLIHVEKQPWSTDTVVKGAQERLPSILMTALVTALAMLPIAIDSDNPGREIMGPMAIIIIGGLISSTLLNLALLPGILYRFGKHRINA